MSCSPDAVGSIGMSRGPRHDIRSASRTHDGRDASSVVAFHDDVQSQRSHVGTCEPQGTSRD